MTSVTPEVCMRSCVKAALALVILPSSADAACFNHVYKPKISYQYRQDIISPIDGWVENAPTLGRTYDAFYKTFSNYPSIRRADENRFAEHFEDYASKANAVVATIANATLMYSANAAQLEREHASEASNRAYAMTMWQSHTREWEDFIFMLQQNQRLPIRSRYESATDIRTRAGEWANRGTTFTYGSGDQAGSIRQYSADIRNKYTDYMRAYELPALNESFNARSSVAVQRDLAARTAKHLQVISCPVQCRVVGVYVRGGQRVNAGQKIASIVSPYHKTAEISFPAAHVFALMEGSSGTLEIEVSLGTESAGGRTLREIAAVRETSSFILEGRFNGHFRSDEDGATVHAEISLRDTAGDSEILLDPFGTGTQMKVVPAEYAMLTKDEQDEMDGSLIRAGRTCE